MTFFKLTAIALGCHQEINLFPVAQPLQVIGPVLHHSAALLQVRRPVILAAGALNTATGLMSNVLATGLERERSTQAAEEIARHNQHLARASAKALKLTLLDTLKGQKDPVVEGLADLAYGRWIELQKGGDARVAPYQEDELVQRIAEYLCGDLRIHPISDEAWRNILYDALKSGRKHNLKISDERIRELSEYLYQHYPKSLYTAFQTDIEDGGPAFRGIVLRFLGPIYKALEELRSSRPPDVDISPLLSRFDAIASTVQVLHIDFQNRLDKATATILGRISDFHILICGKLDESLAILRRMEQRERSTQSLETAFKQYLGSQTIIQSINAASQRDIIQAALEDFASRLNDQFSKAGDQNQRQHSLLATVFPRLSFSRWSLPQLTIHPKRQHTGVRSDAKFTFQELKPYLGTIVTPVAKNDDAGFVFVSEFLPTFVILGKAIRCNLSYREESINSELFRMANGKKKKNRAIVQTSMLLRSKDGRDLSASSEAFPPAPSEGEQFQKRSAVFKHLWGILLNPEIDKIDFLISVFVAKEDCPGYDDNRQEFKAALRREHLAQILTTGYSLFIGILIQLISCAAYINRHRTERKVPDILVVAAAEPFPVVERKNRSARNGSDSSGLLCTFDLIRHVAETVNKRVLAERGRGNVRTFQDFAYSLTESDDIVCGKVQAAREDVPPIITQEYVASEIIRQLFIVNGIRERTALQRTVEYFISESLPSVSESTPPDFL